VLEAMAVCCMKDAIPANASACLRVKASWARGSVLEGGIKRVDTSVISL
jgi:hypothetical protein